MDGLAETLRRSWWVSVACVVAGTLGGVIALQFVETEYTVESVLLLTPEPTETSGTAYSAGDYVADRARSYAFVSESAETRQRLAATAGSTPGSAQYPVVTASVVPDTMLLSIFVTDTTPDRATAASLALAQLIQEQIRTTEGGDGGDPLLRAEVVVGSGAAQAVRSPLTFEYALLGGAFGFLFGLSVVYVLSRRAATPAAGDEAFDA